MDGHLRNVALARQYLKALESGPTGDELAQFFAPEVVLEIFPSKFFPNGSRDDLAVIFAAAERGKKVMTSQKYEIKNELAGGDKVALEIDCTGTLAGFDPIQGLTLRPQYRRAASKRHGPKTALTQPTLEAIPSFS
jgi:SnoaL-like domain